MLSVMGQDVGQMRLKGVPSLSNTSNMPCDSNRACPRVSRLGKQSCSFCQSKTDLRKGVAKPSNSTVNEHRQLPRARARNALKKLESERSTVRSCRTCHSTSVNKAGQGGLHPDLVVRPLTIGVGANLDLRRVASSELVQTRLAGTQDLNPVGSPWPELPDSAMNLGLA